MSNFKFTEDDSLQKLRATFVDDLGVVIDLTLYTPKIRFKSANGVVTLSTMTKLTPPGVDGVAEYVFPAGALKAGEMQGEYMLVDGTNGEISSRKEWTALVRKRVQ